MTTEVAERAQGKTTQREKKKLEAIGARHAASIANDHGFSDLNDVLVAAQMQNTQRLEGPSTNELRGARLLETIIAEVGDDPQVAEKVLLGAWQYLGENSSPVKS